MKLTVISTCGDNRLEATYYYNVEEVKQVSAMLTVEDIRNATDRSYDKNNIVNRFVITLTTLFCLIF